MSNIFGAGFGGFGEISEFSSAASRSDPAISAKSAFRSNQETVFVDVGARKIDANVVRDGISVGVHEINQDVLDNIIIERPPIRLTIVSQSVPVGTPVPVGSAIDVTMARPGQLPIGVITGVLTPIATLTVDEGFDRFVAGNPQVRRIVGVAYVIDRTAAVADAFGRAVAVDGKKKIRFVLRAAAPGKLKLEPNIAALRVHTVAFPPDGLVRTIDLLEEGLFTVDVTPPNAADVREVRAVIRGSFGPERVLPPIGPALQPDAHLVLAPGRPVLVGLPDVITSRFGKLAGVRLVLRASEGTNGGEVTGRLLADASGAPGEPLAGGDVTGITVAPGAEGYHTLRFAEEVEPPTLPEPTPGDESARISCWLELQLGHGSVECGFTGADPNDTGAPGAPVLRRLPGGGTSELTEIPVLGPLRVALRVVGTADRDRPIPAVQLSVRGSVEAVGVNPTADDLLTRVTLQSPLAVSGPVSFDAIAAASGTLTLDTVQVTYKELV